MPIDKKPIFFPSAEAFRNWLDQHHNQSTECYVGYYKVGSGRQNMTWSDSVDQAICYGWIDGRRNRIDDESYMIRFTPRRPNSNWSAVNLKKVKELTAKGLMQPAGLAAFAKRDIDKSGVYAFEQKKIAFTKKYEVSFRKNKKAWAWFESSAPSYRKTCIWWIMSAKLEPTRQRRLNLLIDCCEQGVKIPSQRR